MKFLSIKTRQFQPPQDNLYDLLNTYLPNLKNKDVLVITSKIISIGQGRTVKITPQTDRLQLIKAEADAYLKSNPNSMTVKNRTLTPFSGIDRSNANGYYVLLPKNPHREAKKIWSYLTQKFKLKQFGVIIADSYCLPFRWGHMGISLGFFGFNPLYSYAGQKDIFGRKLVRTNSNLVDALSALAVVYMGEGAEQTPLCLIRGFNKLKFDRQNHLKEFFISSADDLYSPLLKNLKPSA